MGLGVRTTPLQSLSIRYTQFPSISHITHRYCVSVNLTRFTKFNSNVDFLYFQHKTYMIRTPLVSFTHKSGAYILPTPYHRIYTVAITPHHFNFNKRKHKHTINGKRYHNLSVWNFQENVLQKKYIKMWKKRSGSFHPNWCWNPSRSFFCIFIFSAALYSVFAIDSI